MTAHHVSDWLRPAFLHFGPLIIFWENAYETRGFLCTSYMRTGSGRGPRAVATLNGSLWVGVREVESFPIIPNS